MRSTRLHLRDQKGDSLVETIVAAGSLSALSVMMLLPFFTCICTHAKVSTHIEANDSVQLAFERLANDIHTATTIGDIYGDKVTDDSESQDEHLTQNSAGFPSTNDPLYGTGQQPPAGWPSNAPTNGPTPYLWSPSNSTLVVQVPVVDNNGYTTNLPPSLSGQTTCMQPNVETHIYQTLPDENRPGFFKVQLAKIPGAAVPGYDPSAHAGTITLLTGVVGPLDSSGQPKTFQYVDKTDSSGQPQDTVDPSKLSNYNIVVVNLEVTKSSTVNTKTYVGFKSELYLHNTGI